jgi:glucose-6-phosphate isomerase
MPPPPLAAQPHYEALRSLASRRLAAHIWWRRTSVFLPALAPPAFHEAIKNRLGWLDAPDDAARHIAGLDLFAAGVRRDGLTDIYLIGMGGSSLAAEVIRDLSPPAARGPRLTVLDTTDERRIRDVSERLAPERTLFVVASKSGSTIEVTALERHFWSLLARRRGGPARAQFVAVADPETPLAAHATEERYRSIFLNRPDIGGRYSALSLFGLVPAALLGFDLRAYVGSAQRMAAACRPDTVENPGLALGAFLSAEAAAGRDKLTLLTSPSLLSLGAWIEQLVAESVGKDGRGVLPIVGEPLGAPDEYDKDRTFVALVAPGDAATDAAQQGLESTGRFVMRFDVKPADLGGEFFRWEFATAVLGSLLGVNPFDEPNVRDAKLRTAAQLEYRAKTGAFRIDPPFENQPGCLVRLSKAIKAHDPGGRYLAILDYLPADPGRDAVIGELRAGHRRATGHATTYGVGPRYLHSTGQYHKGGPNTGMFVVLTSVDATRTPAPNEGYSFSSLRFAQALGDFEALVAAGRDVVHCHFDTPPPDLAATILRLIRPLMPPIAGPFGL